MSFAQEERTAFVATLQAVGPDAQTLCTGWSSRDLAAHLLARERRLDALPGIVLPAFAARTRRIQNNIAASTDWASLLNHLSAGPPIYSPFRVLDPIANVHEFFVHHEDVRRAVPGWEPRSLGPKASLALRRLAAIMSRPVMAGVPVRVNMRTPDSAVVARVGKGRDVTITADAGELLLFVFGRNEIHASFEGDSDAISVARTWERKV